MSDKDYEPFGEEWIKEMMKFDKRTLLLMLRTEKLKNKNKGE